MRDSILNSGASSHIASESTLKTIDVNKSIITNNQIIEYYNPFVSSSSVSNQNHNFPTNNITIQTQRNDNDVEEAKQQTTDTLPCEKNDELHNHDLPDISEATKQLMHRYIPTNTKKIR